MSSNWDRPYSRQVAAFPVVSRTFSSLFLPFPPIPFFLFSRFSFSFFLFPRFSFSFFFATCASCSFFFVLANSVLFHLVQSSCFSFRSNLTLLEREGVSEGANERERYSRLHFSLSAHFDAHRIIVSLVWFRSHISCSLSLSFSLNFFFWVSPSCCDGFHSNLLLLRWIIRSFPVSCYPLPFACFSVSSLSSCWNFFPFPVLLLGCHLFSFSPSFAISFSASVSIRPQLSAIIFRSLPLPFIPLKGITLVFLPSSFPWNSLLIPLYFPSIPSKFPYSQSSFPMKFLPCKFPGKFPKIPLNSQSKNSIVPEILPSFPKNVPLIFNRIGYWKASCGQVWVELMMHLVTWTCSVHVLLLGINLCDPSEQRTFFELITFVLNSQLCKLRTPIKTTKTNLLKSKLKRNEMNVGTVSLVFLPLGFDTLSFSFGFFLTCVRRKCDGGWELRERSVQKERERE